MKKLVYIYFSAIDFLSRFSSLIQVTEYLHHAMVATLEKGIIFGEMGLREKKPRCATVIAVTNCNLGYIVREDYEKILADADRHRQEKKKRYFMETIFCNTFTFEQSPKVTTYFKSRKIMRGQFNTINLICQL